MPQTFSLLLIIGIIFGSLGALSAYFITYNEWMHHYSTKKEPRKMALEIAVFTFGFFMAIAIIAGFFLK
jgi:hypothetical protein